MLGLKPDCIVRSGSPSPGARKLRAPTSPLRGEVKLTHRNDANRYLEALRAGGEDDAVDWSNVGVVAADREHDVVFAGGNAVGGIEPAPAGVLAAPYQHPGVH